MSEHIYTPLIGENEKYNINNNNAGQKFLIHLDSFTPYFLDQCKLKANTSYGDRTTCFLNTNDLVGIDVISYWENSKKFGDYGDGILQKDWKTDYFHFHVKLLFKDGSKETLRSYGVRVLRTFNMLGDPYVDKITLWDEWNIRGNAPTPYINLQKKLEEIKEDCLQFLNHYLTIHGVKN